MTQGRAVRDRLKPGPGNLLAFGVGAWLLTRGGGLVTALNAVSRQREDAVWVASAMSEEDTAVSGETAAYEVEDLRVTFVEHDTGAYDLMYNKIANPLLWFVQHGIYNLPYSPRLGDETREAWEEGYVAVTETSPRPWLRP